MAATPADLAYRMAVVVGDLDSDLGVVATLLAVVRATLETVPGALCAQVTLPDGNQTIHAPHSTDHPASHPEGRSADGERCPAAPDTCRLNLPMIARGREVGVLTTWCVHAPELHEQDWHIADILATHAALAVHHARQYETLTAARDARDVTGQAKGILMHKYGLTAEQAFDLLRPSCTGPGSR